MQESILCEPIPMYTQILGCPIRPGALPSETSWSAACERRKCDTLWVWGNCISEGAPAVLKLQLIEPNLQHDESQSRYTGYRA